MDCILCFDLRGRSWSRNRGWCDAVSSLTVKWMILSMLSDTVSLFTVEHLVLSNLCCEKSEMCVNISLVVNTPNDESFHAKIWSTFLSFFAGRISPTFYFLYLINFSSSVNTLWWNVIDSSLRCHILALRGAINGQECDGGMVIFLTWNSVFYISAWHKHVWQLFTS